jgi:hypothetical protein
VTDASRRCGEKSSFSSLQDEIKINFQLQEGKLRGNEKLFLLHTNNNYTTNA